MLENILGITERRELARQEEIIGKRKAKALFESGEIDKLEIGTFKGLSDMLSGYIYDGYFPIVFNVNLLGPVSLWPSFLWHYTITISPCLCFNIYTNKKRPSTSGLT